MLKTNPLLHGIENDFVHLCIGDLSRDYRTFSHEDDLPDTDIEIFQGRYFMVHKDNVDEIAEKYPKVFK